MPEAPFHGEPAVAIVTGGAHGIGRAVAERLIRDGFRVVVADTDADRGEATAAEIGARFVACDVSREDDVAALVRAAEQEGVLQSVVSNAGIMVRKPVTELTLDEWRRVIDVNLTGAFLLARHAGPLLCDHLGSMVLIASTRAHMSEPDTEAYSASKGGLVALGHALALSFTHRVRVNVVSPGWINVSQPETELTEDDHLQHPAGRVGTPEDVAAMVSWLVSPEAAFVTGAEFVVDGGMTRKMIYTE